MVAIVILRAFRLELPWEMTIAGVGLMDIYGRRKSGATGNDPSETVNLLNGAKSLNTLPILPRRAGGILCDWGAEVRKSNREAGRRCVPVSRLLTPQRNI
ncbi:MAG: hypothetical protein ABL956_17575 [Hyphomonadaceae bacterium]